MQFFACLLLCTALRCKNHIFSKSLKGRGGVQNVQNVQKVSRRCPEGVQKMSRRCPEGWKRMWERRESSAGVLKASGVVQKVSLSQVKP